MLCEENNWKAARNFHASVIVMWSALYASTHQTGGWIIHFLAGFSFSYSLTFVWKCVFLYPKRKLALRLGTKAHYWCNKRGPRGLIQKMRISEINFSYLLGAIVERYLRQERFCCFWWWRWRRKVFMSLGDKQLCSQIARDNADEWIYVKLESSLWWKVSGQSWDSSLDHSRR